MDKKALAVTVGIMVVLFSIGAHFATQQHREAVSSSCLFQNYGEQVGVETGQTFYPIASGSCSVSYTTK